jgi:hypothetical protein
MHEIDQDSDMVRIPGLYRHWELPQILRMHEAFRIEAAGAHEDGTPLLAVFSSGDGPDLQAVAHLWSQAPDTTGTMSAACPRMAA